MSTLKIAAVQYDIQWLDKNANFSTLEIILSNHMDAHGPVDLVLLPETFSTGFCTTDPSIKEPADGGADLVWLQAMAKRFDAVIAGSVFVAEGAKKANRFYWVWPDGRVEHYDKRHLFRMGKEDEFVAQGTERKVFNIKGVRILPQVCYDLRFPVWSRNRQDYDLMVNVANWPAARRQVWDTLLKARAMENQAYVIGVNRVGSDGLGVAHSGGTCVLDFVGEPLCLAPDDGPAVIACELDFDQLTTFKQHFPAHLDADEFELKP